MNTHIQNETTTELRCENTGRLLAKASHKGLYLFCRQEKKQHFISWNALEQLKESLECEKAFGSIKI